jgi:hypothetical protein
MGKLAIGEGRPYAGNLDLNSKAAGLFGWELLAILKRSSLHGDEPAREGRLANLSADGRVPQVPKASFAA